MSSPSSPEHPHPSVVRHCDVAVVGGSAAGLAAALTLARQRRSVIVVDDATPRNAPAAHMHGYLGREGAPPSELVTVGTEEVRGYGGEVLTGRVLAVHPRQDGRFRVALSGGHALLARRVVAATGLADELPEIEGLAEHWGRDVIHCPFCHGFEVRDRRLVQIVTHPMGLHPTPLLRHLSDDLTVVLHRGEGVDQTALASLRSAGVRVLEQPVVRVRTGTEARLARVELADGSTLDADAVVVGPRFRARVEALRPAGLGTVDHPSGAGEVVDVDPMGHTSVPGLYAAGNLTDPGLQVLPAAAHGSRVGSMVAFDLAGEDLAAGTRHRGERADWEHRYGGEQPVWSANPNGALVAEASALTAVAEASALTAVAEPAARPPGRALDVGCGEGADALWLAEQGWRVTATDISAHALDRLGAEAERRGLAVARMQADVGDPDPFDGRTWDLVSLQYGSFHRSPDGRARENLLAAVAPGGTLLVVGHDLTPLAEPVDVSQQTRIHDPSAYVSVTEIAAALDPDRWQVEGPETRPRPPGAASTHHVADVVLRATRLPH